MFKILLILLFGSSSTVHSEELFECRNGLFKSIGNSGLHVSCGGDERYKSFTVEVRKSDFKKVKVSVEDSYTGQSKQLILPIEGMKDDYLDIRWTDDNYVRIKFDAHALAESHNLKGSVKFESYLLSPDIYVGWGNKRFKLEDLFNENKKSVIKCNYYSQTPDFIKINREIYCFSKGSCTVDGRNVPNRPFFCMAKGSQCPDATTCAIEDKERGYTKHNW